MKGEKRNIEWSQESLNWMSGCEGPEGDGVHCKGCYAKPMATRLRGRFGYPLHDPFSVVFHPDKLKIPFKRKAPRVFFSVSMGDWLYAEGDWRRQALQMMYDCPRHIFVTLTKLYNSLWTIAYDSPENGMPRPRRRGLVEIPMNVIVGISVTNRQQIWGIDKLREVPAFTRMVCFEPLLEDLSEEVDLTGIGWIIIGKRTRQGKIPEFMPEKEWVDRLVAKARELDIPVFLKPAMTGITDRWPTGWDPIQETPYERIRKALQPQQIIPPPPRGRMCGSGGIY